MKGKIYSSSLAKESGLNNNYHSSVVYAPSLAASGIFKSYEQSRKARFTQLSGLHTSTKAQSQQILGDLSKLSKITLPGISSPMNQAVPSSRQYEQLITNEKGKQGSLNLNSVTFLKNQFKKILITETANCIINLKKNAVKVMKNNIKALESKDSSIGKYDSKDMRRDLSHSSKSGRFHTRNISQYSISKNSPNKRKSSLIVVNAALSHREVTAQIKNLNLKTILKRTTENIKIIQSFDDQSKSSIDRDDDFENINNTSNHSSSIISYDSEIKRLEKMKTSPKRGHVIKKKANQDLTKAIKLNRLEMLKFDNDIAASIGKKVVRKHLEQDKIYSNIKSDVERRLKDDYFIKKPLFEISNENHRMFKSKFSTIIPKLKQFSLIEHKEVLQRFSKAHLEMTHKILKSK